MGKVERKYEYKYLGNWIGKKGTVEIQTEEKMKECYRWVSEINKVSKEEEIGRMSTEARLMIYV